MAWKATDPLNCWNDVRQTPISGTGDIVLSFAENQATFITTDRIGCDMPPDSDDDDDAGPDRRQRRGTGHPEERILAPEDLDITEDEKVAEIDDGKFVIGTDGSPSVPQEEGGSKGKTPGANRGGASTRGSDPYETTEPDRPLEGPEREDRTFDRGKDTSSSPGDLEGREVKEYISEELRRTESQYAYRIAAKTGTTVSHQQLASDDIGMAFDGLLMWYAQQVSSDTAVEDALGILLAKSNIRIRYPIKLLAAYLRQHDLSPDDDIADLLEAIRGEEGLVFPPSSRR